MSFFGDEDSSSSDSMFDSDFMMMLLLFSLLPKLLSSFGSQGPPIYNVYVQADEDAGNIYSNPDQIPYAAPDGYTWNWMNEQGLWYLQAVSGGFR
jgi:hypothetical protein